MSGTKAGGQKAHKTNLEKYGDDFYTRIGKQGAATYAQMQKAGTAKPRGFAANKELARMAGSKGGSVSKRTR